MYNIVYVAMVDGGGRKPQSGRDLTEMASIKAV